MKVETNGVYVISDEFFDEFPNCNLKSNDGENRPFYYCFKDEEDLLWMIPLSSKIEKYEKEIERREKEGLRCDIFHIIKLGGKKSVLIIGDIFPMPKQYIKRFYRMNKQNCILKNEKDIRIINKKAKRIVALIKKGVIFHDKQVKVQKILGILEKDLALKEAASYKIK